jgi:hypothetical protein
MKHKKTVAFYYQMSNLILSMVWDVVKWYIKGVSGSGDLFLVRATLDVWMSIIKLII